MGELLTGRFTISYSRKSFPEIIGISFYHLHGLQVHRKQYDLFRSVFLVQSFCPKLPSLSVKRYGLYGINVVAYDGF